jgi:hypothetical protein
VKRIIFFLVGVIFALEVLKIYLQSNLAEESVNVVDMQQQTYKLQLTNSALQIQLLQKEALHTVAAEAAKEGFVPATFIYLP